MTTNNYQEPIPLQLCTYSLSEKMLIRSTADSKTKERVTDLHLFNFDVLWDWPGQGPHLAQEPFVPIILSGLCIGKEVEEQNITYTYIPVNIDCLFSTVQLLANIILQALVTRGNTSSNVVIFLAVNSREIEKESRAPFL